MPDSDNIMINYSLYYDKLTIRPDILNRVKMQGLNQYQFIHIRQHLPPSPIAHLMLSGMDIFLPKPSPRLATRVKSPSKLFGENSLSMNELSSR